MFGISSGLGPPGRAYAHWRETTFNNEFRDLGYVVNDALADGYSLAAMVRAYGAITSSGPLALVESAPEMPIIVIDKTGHAVSRVSRVLR